MSQCWKLELYKTTTRKWEALTVKTSSWHPFPLCSGMQKDTRNFFYVLETAIYNSYVLQAKSTGKKGCYIEWKVNLADGIIEGTAALGAHTVGSSPMRLEAIEWAHFPCQIPPNPVKQNPSRQRQVCRAKGNRSESRWECNKCGASLHMPACLKIFLTVKLWLQVTSQNKMWMFIKCK